MAWRRLEAIKCYNYGVTVMSISDPKKSPQKIADDCYFLLLLCIDGLINSTSSSPIYIWQVLWLNAYILAHVGVCPPSEMFACIPPVAVHPAIKEGSTSYYILDQINNLISWKARDCCGFLDTVWESIGPLDSTQVRSHPLFCIIC